MAWWLTQSVYAIGDEPGNNRRRYRTDVYLNWGPGYARYEGYNTSGGGSVDGQGFSWTGPSDGGSYSGAGSQVINTTDFWINGDTNGWHGDVGASAWFNGGGGYAPGYITSSASTGGFDYSRVPAAVTGVTAVANVDKSVVVSFSGGASPGGSPALSSTYHVSISKNGGAFTGDYTSSGSPITIPSSAISPGSNHVFRVWATNQSSDGAGASADSASIFITAGGRIYNGTAWVPTVTARIYNGTAWVPIATARIYDGTAWRNMT